MNKKNQALQATMYSNMRHGLPTTHLLSNMDLDDLDRGLETEILARLAQNPDAWRDIYHSQHYCDRKYFFITALQLPIPPTQLFDIMTESLNWMHGYALPYLVDYIIKNEALDEWLTYIDKRSAKNKKGLLTLGSLGFVTLLQKYPLNLLLPHINNELKIESFEFEQKTGAFLYTGDAVRDLVVATALNGALSDFFVGYYYDDPLWLSIAYSDGYCDINLLEEYPLLNVIPFDTASEKIQAYITLTTKNNNEIEECDLCLT